MKLIHIDTAGPYHESLGGSRYVTVSVNSVFRLQQPYGTRDKSASVILVVKRFVADTGISGALQTNNGLEYINRTFTEYCDGLGIRRELTALYTPQRNGPVESSLARTTKAGLAARLEVNKIFLDAHLERVKGVRDRVGSNLWLESVLWVAEAFNRSAASANEDMLSPHEVFDRGRPPMPLLPCSMSAYRCVSQQLETEPRA